MQVSREEGSTLVAVATRCCLYSIFYLKPIPQTDNGCFWHPKPRGYEGGVRYVFSSPGLQKQTPRTALFVGQTQGWGVGMAGLDSTLRKNTRTFLTRDGGRRGCLRWSSVFGAHTHPCRLPSLLCSRQTLGHPSSCRFPACLTPWTPSAQGAGAALRQLSEWRCE